MPADNGAELDACLLGRTTFLADLWHHSCRLVPAPWRGIARLASFLAAKRHSEQFGRPGRLHIHTSKKLRAPADFALLGSAQKIKLLGDRSVLPRTLTRFIEDITHANLLKQVRGSLRGISSSFFCYLAFCERTKIPPFPPFRGNFATLEQRL